LDADKQTPAPTPTTGRSGNTYNSTDHGLARLGIVGDTHDPRSGWPPFKRSRLAGFQRSVTVDRRNKIAHEADVDPSAPGCRWPISPIIVEEALGFLDGVANAIAEVVGP